MRQADPRTGADSAPVRDRLAARIEEIVARAPQRITAEEVERDRLIVAECRYLMRLLSTRRRSRGEMDQRLREREVDASARHEVLARMDRAGLIDDAAFAAEWVRQRRQRKGLADEALRRELEDKHVVAAHIDEALGKDERGEEELCRELVRSRLRAEARVLRGLPEGGPEWAKVARRLDGYLRRRGYGGALATHVISTEMRAVTGR